MLQAEPTLTEPLCPVSAADPNPANAAVQPDGPNVVPFGATLTASASASMLLAACGGGGDGGGSDGSGGVSGGSGGSGQDNPAVPPALGQPQWTEQEAARFLQQAQFSSTRAEIGRLLSDGDAARWLQRQYQTPASASGWDWLASQGYDVVDSNNHFSSTNPAEHMLWWQLLSGPDAMRKRTALALSEFFVSSLSSADFTWRSHAYASWWDLLVTHAFGNFRVLLENVTLHPAMGYYLNTKGNRKEDTRTGRVPDENYAREVMQLFTIGLVNLNLDGSSQGTESYTQEDVTQLARVFTGYDFDRSDGVRLTRPGSTSTIESNAFARKPMSLNPANHSLLEARFLGTVVPANTPGPQALRIALDALFNHPNVGPFFARQMIQRLVTSNPSPAYIARVASRFNNNGAGVRGDLSAVWSAILLDEEARGPAGLSNPAFGKLREPMLRFIQWARSFGVQSAAGTWKITNLSNASTQLGQSPLRSPSVFNFFRPGYVPPSTAIAAAGATAPEFQLVNETSVGGYLNFMQGVIERGLASGDIAANHAPELALANDAAALVEHVVLVLAAGQVSPASRAVMVSALNATPIPTTSTPANIERAQRQRVWAAILMVMGCPEYLVQK